MAIGRRIACVQRECPCPHLAVCAAWCAATVCFVALPNVVTVYAPARIHLHERHNGRRLDLSVLAVPLVATGRLQLHS